MEEGRREGFLEEESSRPRWEARQAEEREEYSREWEWCGWLGRPPPTPQPLAIELGPCPSTSHESWFPTSPFPAPSNTRSLRDLDA